MALLILISSCAPYEPVVEQDKEQKETDRSIEYVQHLMEKDPEDLTDREIEYLKLHAQQQTKREVSIIRKIYVTYFVAGIIAGLATLVIAIKDK